MRSDPGTGRRGELGGDDALREPGHSQPVGLPASRKAVAETDGVTCPPLFITFSPVEGGLRFPS
jgi:hypothetical protein